MTDEPPQLTTHHVSKDTTGNVERRKNASSTTTKTFLFVFIKKLKTCNFKHEFVPKIIKATSGNKNI